MPRTAAPRTPATPTNKAPAKKTTGSRTPRKASSSTAGKTAKAPTKTTARKTAAADPGKATKKATTGAARTKTTPAAVKKATVWPEFITHKMINAHYQARLHDLPTLHIRDWRELADGTAALHFPSGARLDHTPTEDAPFHANTPCPHGSMHRQPVRTRADLTAAEETAKACTEHAGSTGTANIAVTRVTPALEPAEADGAPERVDDDRHTPTWVQQLPGDDPITKTMVIPDESVHQAAASAAETQPMSRDAITEGLAARAAEQPADNDQTREHPQP